MLDISEHDRVAKRGDNCLSRARSLRRPVATGPRGRRCRRYGSPTSSCHRSVRRNNAEVTSVELPQRLARLASLSSGDERADTLIRLTCGRALALPPVPPPADVPDGLKIAVFTPINRPALSSKGPPELPGLMAASV